ncbi:OmpA family protein [bacterium]|nr:OmpA family protein [bacterium]
MIFCVSACTAVHRTTATGRDDVHRGARSTYDLGHISDRWPAEVADSDAAEAGAAAEPVFPILYFGVNIKGIPEEVKPILNTVADTLRTFPSLRIRIESHTDSYGAPAYNLELSRRRSEALKTRLIQSHGIAPNRLEAVGWGMSKPVASFQTPEGRRANRRTEFIVVEGGR